ncbi:recombinase family protein [Gluconobacter oxydans]|uniref:DNA integration/recombination/inversion protein n=2 Tax=Gluconobacter oxydans TaxID=442 RepID=A0A067Z1P0_GLUOY|nr:DNA integration/recombination/inversion protein [Gluconobacter oxydans DSM 3504]
MTERVALYGRFSDDRQNASSAQDQIRHCRRRAEAEGWAVIASYTDEAISGAVRNRPQYQKLRHAIDDGEFTIVMAESLDRLSRSQEDTANLYEMCQYRKVRLFTLSEGWISELQIGLSSTINAVYLRQLAEKTHRGLSSRIESGRSAGGLSYGYRVPIQPNGLPQTGQLEIVPEQAVVIRRIFAEYGRGVSPRSIAAALNAEGIPVPQHGARRGDGTWRANAIQGNRKRGTGILNNELYIGRRVWNRLRYVHPPGESKRIFRLNPESEWKIEEVPALRIVDQDAWDTARERQRRIDAARAEKDTGDATHLSGTHVSRRPTYLLSGLVRCGACGGTMNIAGSGVRRFYCANAREKGRTVCQGIKGLRKDVLEHTIVHGLKEHLMQPEAVQEFSDRYAAHQRSLDAGREESVRHLRASLLRTEKEIANVMTAIKAGIFTETTKAELEALEARRKHQSDAVAQAQTTAPALPPNLAEIYCATIMNLTESLTHPDTVLESSEAMRSLIDRIIVSWDAERAEHRIELEGKLIALLNAGRTTKAQNAKNASGNEAEAWDESSLKLVAGAGFEPAAFRL